MNKTNRKLTDPLWIISLSRTFTAAAFLAWAPISQSDGNLLLTGAELREHGTHYVYLGNLSPVPGNNRLGEGWIQRYWLDAFTYEYESNARRIEARAYGAEAALGYQHATGQGNVGGSLGLRYQHTSLNPFDPGSEVRGNQVWPKFQLEADVKANAHWRAGLIAAYVFNIDGYWVRGRLLRELSGARQAGLELIAQGDPNYSAQKLGLVYGGVKLGERWSANARAGYHFQENTGSPYVAIELALNY